MVNLEYKAGTAQPMTNVASIPRTCTLIRAVRTLRQDWFVARHVFYLMAMWGIWIEVIPIGCYHGSQGNMTGLTPLPERGWILILDLFHNPSGTICYSKAIQEWFIGSLGFLQVLNIAWFIMIIKIAIRVVKGGGATDIRSVNESEDDGE